MIAFLLQWRALDKVDATLAEIVMIRGDFQRSRPVFSVIGVQRVSKCSTSLPFSLAMMVKIKMFFKGVLQADDGDIKVSLREITLWGQERSDPLSHEDPRTSSFHLWLFVAVKSFYFRPTSHIFVVQHPF
jgi:hypothetical protein